MKRIELDQFCQISYAGGLSSSSDGDKLCFIKSIADLDNNKYSSNLWLYEKDKGIKQLTSSGTDRQAQWLDESRIAFFSKRVKDDKYQKTRVYTIDVHGGEAQLLLETCHEISSFKVLDDSHWLVSFLYHPDRFERQQQQDLEGLIKASEDTEGWEEFDEAPFWSNGEGITNKQRNALGILDLNTCKIEVLTDKLTDVYHYDLSADKKQVAYVSNSFKNLMSFYNSIGLIDLKTKEKRDLSHEAAFMYERCQFNPQGQIVMLGKSCEAYGLNENAYFYLIDPATGATTPYSIGFDASVGCSVGSDVKYGAGGGSDWLFTPEGMVFSSTQGHSCNLYVLKDDGSVTPLTSIDGALFDYQPMGETIVFNALNHGKPMELYQLANGEISPLTDFNAQYGTEYFLSQPEGFTFTNRDGIEISGWVMKPRDFNPHRQYPTILNIHGGPKTVYGSVYYHEMQYWASEGFAVIYCNPRGSDGKGNAFADIRGLYGTIDYNDILDFVDEAIARYPWIHHDQLGVTGGSYGGFMTNWLIGHTNRFKAAATQRCISNWVSEYGTTDIGYYFVQDQVGANPWSDIDKLWDQSPLKYADQIKTPLLILHSDEDYRCWMAEGLQLFTALKVNHVPCKMVLFHGENHELSRSGKPKNRFKRLKELTSWMKTHIHISED